MLSAFLSGQSHFSNKDGSGDDSGGSGGFSQDQLDAQRNLQSTLNVLTSAQNDADPNLITIYSELPKSISGETVWSADEYRGESNAHKWVHTWTPIEISQLEETSKLWLESGRELGEIERATFPLPSSLVNILTTLRG